MAAKLANETTPFIFRVLDCTDGPFDEEGEES